ncbi:SLC13 family permease [Calditrichota bacterium GD2]
MGNEIIDRVISSLRKNIFLVLLFVLSAGLTIIMRQPFQRFPVYVDWHTIVTLSGLLIITTSVKESGFFYFLAYRISRKINNERLLALFLILLSSILSMFLTNDIALFIAVPLTLSLQDISDNDYTKMIVFEAIAVNVGSSLTPIGNPQNIFLWHKWGISFPAFIREMSLFVVFLLMLLLIFTYFNFPAKKIKSNYSHYPVVKNKLFVNSFILLVLFAIAIELRIDVYFLAIIVLLFLLFYRPVILKADWGLILVFIFVFINVRLLSQLSIVQSFFRQLDFNHAKTLFFAGAFLSQVISNVPATVLLTHFSIDYKIIAYAVNIGGNGLVIASFANLIALNFIKSKSKYFTFHIYSMIFFIVTLILASLIFLF